METYKYIKMDLKYTYSDIYKNIDKLSIESKFLANKERERQRKRQQKNGRQYNKTTAQYTKTEYKVRAVKYIQKIIH